MRAATAAHVPSAARCRCYCPTLPQQLLEVVGDMVTAVDDVGGDQ